MPLRWWRVRAFLASEGSSDWHVLSLHYRRTWSTDDPPLRHLQVNVSLTVSWTSVSLVSIPFAHCQMRNPDQTRRSIAARAFPVPPIPNCDHHSGSSNSYRGIRASPATRNGQGQSSSRRLLGPRGSRDAIKAKQAGMRGTLNSGPQEGAK